MSSPGFTADDVRNVVFTEAPRGSRGYDENEVDNYLDEVERALVAGEPIDTRTARFHRPPIGKRGYDEAQVDAFLARVSGTGDVSTRPTSVESAPAVSASVVGTEQPFVTSRGWLSLLRGRG